MTLTKREREKEAIQELENLLRSRFPHASFSVVKGSDPPGTYLEVSDVTTNFDDLFDAVMTAVRVPLSKMQNEERLKVYVMPLHGSIQLAQ